MTALNFLPVRVNLKNMKNKLLDNKINLKKKLEESSKCNEFADCAILQLSCQVELVSGLQSKPGELIEG